jgi:hypothetical protein
MEDLHSFTLFEETDVRSQADQSAAGLLIPVIPAKKEAF